MGTRQKNLKVLMSGDTTPYRQEIDKAAVATKSMKADISGQLSQLSAIFGVELGTLGQSAQKVSLAFNGLVSSMKFAAAGGSEAATANAALTAASNAVASAEARLILANQALAVAQADASISAEALAAAELEASGATVALATAQKGLTTAQKASTAATTLGSIAMNIFKVALISTGIGVLIVALGSLVAYFTQTREGAKFIKVALAALGAEIRVLIDHFSSFGEGIFKLFTGDWKGSMAAFKSSVTGIGTELKNAGVAAAELQRQKNIMGAKARADDVEIAQMNARASRLREEARDAEMFDVKTRAKKLQDARQIYEEAYKMERELKSQKLRIHQEQMALHKATTEDLETERDLKVSISELDQFRADQEKGLLREKKRVTNEINAQTDALIKNAEAQRRIDKEQTDKLRGQTSVEFRKNPSDTRREAELKSDQDERNKLFDKNNSKPNEVQDEAWRKTKSQIKETKTAYLDLSDTVRQAAEDLAISTGEMLGNLISGQGGLQSFGDLVATSFANLAVTIGKQMIQFGMSGIALQKLIISPWAAVAAGIALVALGTAAKNSISSTLSSGGTSSAISGGQNYNFDTRHMALAPVAASQKSTVNVQGEFKISGRDLRVVLEKEDESRYRMT